MDFIEMLERKALELNSIVCMGADPIIEKIPVQAESIEEKIFLFYSEIIEACSDNSCLPSALKPNYAFFAQYGFDGLRALKKTCVLAKRNGIPLILDAKRADIGNTSRAYAIECFGFWEADAATVNPFMGSDSVMPFIEWCTGKGKGIYVLNRTSNPGASDFQDKIVSGKELFRIVSEKIIEWNEKANNNLGAVVGATSLKELESIASFFVASERRVPILVPGVGAQGASAESVAEILRKTGYGVCIARINSSSGINYAFEKEKTSDYAEAAAREVMKLNREIGPLNS